MVGLHVEDHHGFACGVFLLVVLFWSEKEKE
jgi:hypothetical protein